MSEGEDATLFDPDAWTALSFAEHRDLLAAALLRALDGAPGVTGATIQVGPVDRPYDLTAALETDVGVMRTPLWSDARAVIFRDPSIHPANRKQIAPGLAVRDAADRFRRRLDVRFNLESRGLTVTLAPEDGVERVWSAERSLFRGKTAVTREDRVAKAGDVDLRDLLAHFYAGPSLRLVGEDGTAFLLPAGSEDADARLVTLCHGCGRWAEGPDAPCEGCEGPRETVAAARPVRR